MPSWIRHIPEDWETTDGWKTDIPLTILRGPIYDYAEFRLTDGTDLKIPMHEMRRAVLGRAPIRSDKMIIGPFEIDHQRHIINGMEVNMTVACRTEQRCNRRSPAPPDFFSTFMEGP